MAESLEAFWLGGEVLVGFSDSSGEADEGGEVFGAGAEAVFLAAADDDGPELDLVTGPEGSDAFGAVDFGGTEGEEVDAETVDFDVEQAETLGGVAVEEEGGGVAGGLAGLAFGLDEGGDIADGLDGAEFAAG